MSRVPVSEPVLRWAIDRSGKTVDDLQARFPRIGDWALGVSSPTLRQLESLARATKTPLGFFFLKEPPNQRLPIPYFRTVGDYPPERPSPDLLETVHTMQRRQSWLREFLVEEDQDRLPFIASARATDSPDLVARQLRSTLHLEDGWAGVAPSWSAALRVLRRAAERTRILVFVNGVVGNNTHRKLDPQDFRGFVLVDEYAPLVFINSADAKAAQMFTLAHELAHLCLGQSAAFDLRDMQPARDSVEQACNRIAAEFLVPERNLRQLWQDGGGDVDAFETLARRFKVSVLVVARRCLDLGLIARETFFDFYRAYEQREHEAGRVRQGGDFYATQGSRLSRPFAVAVLQAVREGKLLYEEAYRLTGLCGKTFEQYANSVEMERR